jgi:hypothetical protein
VGIVSLFVLNCPFNISIFVVKKNSGGNSGGAVKRIVKLVEEVVGDSSCASIFLDLYIFLRCD